MVNESGFAGDGSGNSSGSGAAGDGPETIRVLYAGADARDGVPRCLDREGPVVVDLETSVEGVLARLDGSLPIVDCVVLGDAPRATPSGASSSRNWTARRGGTGWTAGGRP